jgi:omega-6 fatty acid desaturase (delta-12 desaturase)
VGTAPLELRQERLALSRRGLALPLAFFLGILSAYVMTVLGILAAPLWAAAILVPLCGILVVMLFVIGHDACHLSYTASHRLNHVIGRVAFLPSVHLFSLWDHEHNQRHHRFNNIKHLDYIWTPMSPDEFANAAPLRRIAYRIFRHGAGVPLYYFFEVWLRLIACPRRALLGRIRPVHLLDAVLVWGFVALHVVVLATVGSWFGKGALESVTLAFLLPLAIFMALMSAAVYMHHTHHAVPWYATTEEWEERGGTIYGTVHVEFPWLVRKVILHIMEHNAHHYAPGVPLYRLSEMQKMVERPGVVTWRFSIAEYADVTMRCKLFDYEASRWVDFSGVPTSGPLRLAS